MDSSRVSRLSSVSRVYFSYSITNEGQDNSEDSHRGKDDFISTEIHRGIRSTRPSFCQSVAKPLPRIANFERLFVTQCATMRRNRKKLSKADFMSFRGLYRVATLTGFEPVLPP